MKTNVFVVGLDQFNLTRLNSIDHAAQYRFRSLLELGHVKQTDQIDLIPLVEEAKQELKQFGDSVDAIIGFWDFPVSLMVPYLCAQYNLPAPSLEAVLRAEHKYWSRYANQTAAPETCPDFFAVSVDNPPPLSQFPFQPPFWLKPCIAHSSQLGLKIESEEQYNEAMPRIRNEIGKFSDAYDRFVRDVNVHSDLTTIGGRWCIAESLIGGDQCTLSGYKYNGEIHAYGLVDSINYEQAPSFFRYEYPSQLPVRQFKRMKAITERVINQLALDNTAFNVEFFLDRENDKLWLLEINTRMSQSHAHLYEMVDGVSNHQVVVELATGKKPHMPEEKGPFEVAAKFHPRKFEDAHVTRVPTDEDIRRLEKDYPGTVIIPEAKAGQNLSDQPGQDSYSYRLCLIYTAAQSRDELLKRYEQILDRLPYEFDDPK